MTFLHLPRDIYDDLRLHGEHAYPQECCGALLGHATPHGWQIVSHVRAVKARAAATHTRFDISPSHLDHIQNLARRRGLAIAGYYHSHPDQPAQPSSIDLAEAHALGCCYLITQVAQGRAAATTAFLLTGSSETNRRFDPLSIEFANPTTSS